MNEPKPMTTWRHACEKHGGVDYNTLHYPGES